MTNRRVLRHAEASLVRSCVILSSPETADPLSLRDIPLTGGHPARLLWHCQRSPSSQIKVRQGRCTDISRWGKAGREKKPKRKSRSFDLLFFLALLVGLEPTTYGLTVRRSTD